jgi:hypothetical protein
MSAAHESDLSDAVDAGEEQNISEGDGHGNEENDMYAALGL